MSIKLRELIRAVRACKTAQEERAVISKECALIRTAFKDNNIQFRHRNVAKLLYIHMLGYPSHFGQMECLKLIASPNFPEKRIGYLALMLLLDERTDILTLATNSIKNDLTHTNQFVAGLALTSVGNLATGDMGRILVSDTDLCLRGSNPYLKKKAALVLVRIFKRVPEMIDEFSDKIVALLKERTHGVLIAAVQLMTVMVELDASQAQAFARLVPSLVRLLKNLLSMSYAPEHDVAGITDPFLQVKLLRLLQLLGHGNEETSETMNDMLAQVATSTETAKNAGNAILYECVKAIMTIEAESGLRVLAVNILGRFLLNRDNNIRYVALNTLSKVVANDMDTVQRHRATIVECLKDPDVSIRQRALELIYQLTSSTNVEDLMREMLNYLVVASSEQKSSLCSKIMITVDKFSPSRKWQIDTLITMLSIAGNSCDESIGSNTVMYISQSEELHQYIAHKLFDLLADDLSQLALMHVGVWCVGEYGNLLLTDCPPVGDSTGFAAKTPTQVVDLVEKCKKSHNATPGTKTMVLTTLLKLTQRMEGAELPRIVAFIDQFKESMDTELQQRSCEFSSLLQADWDALRPDTLVKMPVFNEELLKAKRARDTEEDGFEGEMMGDGSDGGGLSEAASPAFGVPTLTPPTGAEPANGGAGGGGSSLLDLDDIFGGGEAAPAPAGVGVPVAPANGGAPTPAPVAPASTNDLLADIFATPAAPPPAPVPAAGGFPGVPMGGGAPVAPLPVPVPVPAGGDDPFAGGGGFVSAVPPAAVPVPVPPSNPIITAFEKGGLKLTMELTKTDPNDPKKSDINCTFTNAGAVDMSNLVFQAAVPKFVTLAMQPPSGTTVPATNGGVVTQVVSVVNNKLGEKTLMLRMKIQYTVNGTLVAEQGQISDFPQGY